MQRKAAAPAAFMVLLIGVLICADLIIAGLSLHALLIAILIAVLMFPLGYRMVHGGVSLFEPLILVDIAFGVMFVGRPLADLVAGRNSHLGHPIMPTFDATLVVVVVAVLAFQIGYHLPTGRRLARRLHKAPHFKAALAGVAGWMFFILGGLLFIMFLAHGGGLRMLAILLEGRSSTDNQIFLDSTGYFYNGLLLWAASALIFFALAVVRYRRINYLWFALSALPLVVYFGARGARSQLLPLIVAVPTFWYLWQRRRPTIRMICLVLFFGIVLIGWVRETRTVGASPNQGTLDVLIAAAVSPVKQVSDILNGADNEMFDSLANELSVVPSKVGFSPGHSVLDIFIRGVPRTLWPSKPLESNGIVVTTLWPIHYSKSRASAAFSIVGPFYFDSGLVGVALGMLAIGIMLTTVWHWYLRNQYSVIATLIYSMGLPFVVILMRGTITDTLGRMLFMFVPLALLALGSRIHVRSYKGINMSSNLKSDEVLSGG